MITTIRKGASKKGIQDLFKELENKNKSWRGFDDYKFCGAVTFCEDALQI